MKICPFPGSSLNRLCITQKLHGTNLAGKTGRELLSGAVLRQLQGEFPTSWQKRAGKRLAALLYTLRKGMPWSGHPEASKLGEIRRFWRQTPRVLLGGGFIAGERGKMFFNETIDCLTSWGAETGVYSLFSPAQHMPLFGAAAGQPEGTLCLDFGHGSVKGMIKGAEEEIITHTMDLNDLHEGMDPEFAKVVVDKVTMALSYFRKEFSLGLVPALAVSIAAYVEDGVFMKNDRGAYCKLVIIEENAEKLFGELWEKAGSTAAEVRVFHDGTAAARNLSSPGAAIVLGTSIGHGFSESL